MQYRIVALCAPGLLLPAIGATQTEATDLAPIIVSASREPEPATEALASVSVIDRQDIERTQPQSVLDLLRTQSGIDIATNGGLGSVSSVFMRGAESDQVLVLVDGVRAGSATAGTFAFNQLNPAQIERIEIVRGPRASLYGSDAVGGVIQIFTRRLDGPSASIEGGSYDTYRAQAGYGGGERVRYSVNGAYVKSHGFSSTNANNAFGFNPDDDGYEERSATASVDARLWDGAALALRGWHSDGEIEFDDGVTDTRNNTFNLRLHADTLPSWRQTFGAGYAIDHQDTAAEPDDFSSVADTDRLSFNWQNDIALGRNHQLTAGADYYRDDGDFDSGFGAFDESINDLGGYVNLRSSLGANDVDLSVRYDEHSEFGGHATGQLALGRQFTDALRGFASFGTAFKAPTLNELFFPGSGNAGLDPERSRSTELGLQFQPSADHVFNASVFYTEVDDLIDTVFVGPGPFDFQSRNVDEAIIKGLELGYDATIATSWNFYANVTLQDARNDTDGTDLVRRPDRKAAFGLTRSFENGGSIYTEVLLSGDRTDVGDVPLPGYGIVNLSLQYPLLDSLFAEARVENVLDKEYELASGFNTSDRAGYVGLRYTPVQAD